jgi:hypothetical protein
MSEQAKERCPTPVRRRSAAAATGAAALLLLLLVPAAGSARSATAPTNVGEPRVTGTAMQGQTLTTSNGTWSGTAPFTFRYRWLRCDTTGGGVNGVKCATIPGETRRTYILRAADVGHRIRSRVIATNADGTASANSNATPIVKASAGRPANQSPPTITGTPQENQTLTAHNGTWTGDKPISYSYQWFRCDQTGGSCSAINGATAATYVLKNVDIGNTLRVRVTAKNNLGSRNATSAPTAVIAKAGAPGGASISVNEVSLPNRLIIDRVSYRPRTARPGARIVARFRVSDSHDHRVSGALVFVVGVPFGTSSTPPETPTGPDGWVTFQMRATRHAGHAGIVYFVRARRPGEPLLGGISTRRLTFLPGR